MQNFASCTQLWRARRAACARLRTVTSTARGYLRGRRSGGDDGRATGRDERRLALVLDLQLRHGASLPEDDVAQDAAADHLAAEQRAERDAALLVEADVLEEHEGRRDRDLLVPRLARRIREEARRVVAAAHDEAERLPGVDVEQQIGRLPELDAVQPLRAVADVDDDAVAVAGLGQRRLRAHRELGHELDRVNLARQLGEDRGLVAGAGADVEHALAAAERELLADAGDHV